MFEIKDNHLKLFEEFNLENTRDRLIKTAMEMFAEQGFDKTSVRELAKKANANIAAINYHFGGKEGLYQAVLEYIIDYMDSWAMPLVDAYDTFLKEQNGTFEMNKTINWIEEFIDTFITRAFESYESNILLHKIIVREQLKPSLGFNKIYSMASLKLAEHIISDLLNKISDTTDTDKIIIYTNSIIGLMHRFVSANSSVRAELNVKDFTESQKKDIKELIIYQVKNTLLQFLKG
ncbi:CerR family C-terminal domain-containing protein [Arcobacter arenosus]|uniref:DUF1956 domain-containing protein n=1 Tax=Arcobacter arenosus TaxID=2576037 RepID=A0A5R8Y0L2_9BACT|nr:CerR family C-terminal domain-containing protein [Arcobacter arenosus]TLP38297.1 DUF1956 domain-containing protein [Arcobacter arenosus]